MTSHMKPAVGRKIKAIQAKDGEKFYVGVDVHKRSYSVAIWSDQRGHVAQWTQPSDPAVLIGRLADAQQQVAWIVHEAGPTGFGLVRALRSAGFNADVIATSKLLRTVSADAKSDRLDCRRLAEHAAKDLLHKIRVPSEQEERDRQIVRLREQMVRKRRNARQQIKSFLLTHGIDAPEGLSNWSQAGRNALRSLDLPAELQMCLDVLCDEEAHADQQVQRMTEAMQRLAARQRHKKKVRLMRTVPGVGPVTAMTFQTELIDPHRFDDGGQVAKMIGLTPGVRESGERRREGPLLKTGNWRLRTALVEAAWRWVNKDPTAKATFGRLMRNTGDVKKAIVGMARRLAILLWRLVTREQPYRLRLAA